MPSSSVFNANSSVRTSEVNIIATEAPPTLSQVNNSFCVTSSSSFSSQPLPSPSISPVCVQTTTEKYSSNLRPKDIVIDGPLREEVKASPAAATPSNSNIFSTYSDDVRAALAAFHPLRSSSYLSDEDMSEDIIAVAFGTFDTKLGNSIDYHYPHTAATDGTSEGSSTSVCESAITANTNHGEEKKNETEGMVPIREQQESTTRQSNRSSSRVCCLDFNALNKKYRLQDFCFPDGSHDSFVDTIPFVITSDGGVDRIDPLSSRAYTCSKTTSTRPASTTGDALPPFPIFGFACYHLHKDPKVHRGAVQRSFLVLSRRPLFHCLRRVARQAFVPFFDAVPYTDVKAHRRFVRAIYESLFIAFSPISLGLSTPPHVASSASAGLCVDAGEGGEAKAPLAAAAAETTVEDASLPHTSSQSRCTPISIGNEGEDDEYARQLAHRGAVTQALLANNDNDNDATSGAASPSSSLFSSPEDSLRDVRYFSLVFDWPSVPKGTRRRHSKQIDTEERGQEGKAGDATSSPMPPLPHPTFVGLTPPNPEEAPTVPISEVLRERSLSLAVPSLAVVGAGGKEGKKSRSQSIAVVDGDLSCGQNGLGKVSRTSSTIGHSKGKHAQSRPPLPLENPPSATHTAISAAVAQAASAISSVLASAVSSAAPRIVEEDKPVGCGLVSCEVDVVRIVPSSGQTAQTEEKPRVEAVLDTYLLHGNGSSSTAGGAGSIVDHNDRPPLKLNLHFPLILPRSDASLIEQLSFGASVKTLLKWFGADKLATIHYCMLARYPVLFVGQHADQVSTAVCASAHLLSPFTQSNTSQISPSLQNSDASFMNNTNNVGGGGGGQQQRGETAILSTAPPQYSSSSNPANSNPTFSPTAAAVQFDVSAFIPYATLEMMDRVLEVVAKPTYANHTAVGIGNNTSTTTCANFCSGVGGTQLRCGGNGVGYYIAVGATNVFIMNKDVQGMLKCNVNDGTVTFCNNSTVKKVIGDCKGLSEARKLWQTLASTSASSSASGPLLASSAGLEGGGGGGSSAAATFSLSSFASHSPLKDKYVRECYFRLWVQRLNLEIKAECDAKLASGVHYRSLMLGIRGCSSGGGGGLMAGASSGGVGLISIFENGQQHITTEESGGFLLVDDVDELMRNVGGGVRRGIEETDEVSPTSAEEPNDPNPKNPSTSPPDPPAAAGTIQNDKKRGLDPSEGLRTFSYRTGVSAASTSRLSPSSSNPAVSLPSLHVEFSSALSNYLHLARKNRRILTETDCRYQRLVSALQRTVASESGEELVSLGQELAAFSAVEEAVAGPDPSVELCPSRPLDACAYQVSCDRDIRLRVVVDFRQRSFCFIDALTRGNYRALARRTNLYVSDFFLANTVRAEVYNLPQQVVLFQTECQQVLYANRVKYKTSGTVYLTRNFLLFQAGKFALTKRHQIVPLDLIRGVSKYSKGILFENASVRMMIDMVPDREEELTHGTAGPNLYVDKKSMNETTALLSFTNMGSAAVHETFYEILLGLYLRQKAIVESMRGIPQVHLIPDGGAERMKTAAGVEMICPLWIPRGLYTTSNTIVVDEVWENQRLYPLVGWKSRLLPSDPASFSDFSCLRELSISDSTAGGKAFSFSKTSKKGVSDGDDGHPEEACPIPGFKLIDKNWRPAFELSEEAEERLRGGGGGSEKERAADQSLQALPLLMTTDKLLATNRGAHKALEKKENKFDQGFLYSFSSNWTVADGFRTHECAGGVIRRRLWVRRRALVVNPEATAYQIRREKEARARELAREFGAVISSADCHTNEKRASSEHVPPQGGGRQRTGRNPPPPPSRALLKKVDSLAVIFNAMQAEKRLESAESPTKKRRPDEDEGANEDEPHEGDKSQSVERVHLSASALRSVPDGRLSDWAASSSWRRRTRDGLRSAKVRGGNYNDHVGDDDGEDGGRGRGGRRISTLSASTDSTDVIDPLEVDEALSAPVSEQNDDGGMGGFSSAAFAALGQQRPPTAEAEAARRARIDAEGALHVAPQWEGHRRGRFEHDGSL